MGVRGVRTRCLIDYSIGQTLRLRPRVYARARNRARVNYCKGSKVLMLCKPNKNRHGINK